ncbi:unnamed protein product [Auanema sp. JU1783]|nr:unnamed protein product [Auanema sp. JU1783]
MDYFVIDTSTPESLERDFYAWLNNSTGSYYDETESQLPLSLPPLQDLKNTENIYEKQDFYMNMYNFMDSSVGSSPSSLSSSSLDPTESRQNEKDVARSSGRNQLGRTYSPGLPLSMFEREEIVRLFQSGWKICDISKRLCVTHSCVSKILNRYRQTGSVRPKDAKEGRAESPLVIAVRDYRMRLERLIVCFS